MQLSWQIDCEWVCDVVRTRVWHEGLSWLNGLKLLTDAFNCDQVLADEILRGVKVIKGINEGTVTDDNKFDEYKLYLDKTDRENRRLLIQEDMEIHPLNYVDPFATFYSYWAFDRMHRNRASQYGDYADTVSDVLRFFEYHEDEYTREINDLSRKFLKGGCYGLEDKEYLFNNRIIDAPVGSPEKFWDSLYTFFEKLLAEEDWLSDEDRRDILRRQNNHLAWRRKQERKVEYELYLDNIVQKKIQEHRDEIEGQGREFDYLDSYDLLDKKHKYLSTLHMSEYGIITPIGEFFACGRASHNIAAYKLCMQRGMVDAKDSPVKWGNGSLDLDVAKDLLFNLGYTYVNTQGNPGLYNKWNMDYEIMPQKAIDGCSDWLYWWRENND